MSFNEITINGLLDMAKDILDLTPDGWERSIYFDLSKLTEECGEVAEALNKTRKSDEDLANELADVLVVCAIIALKKNIDLNQASTDKQIKNISKLLHRFHDGLYPEGFSPRVKI